MNLPGPVAIVAAGELFGGAERHILGLGAFLRRSGLAPHVILFHDRELAARCRQESLPVTVLPVRGSRDLRGPRHLEARLDALGARVVHVHGYRAAVNAALAPTVRPLVFTLHGQGEPKWHNGISFVKDRVYRLLETWACRRRRAVICFVTDDLRRRHGHRYGGLPLRTIPNGIPPLDRTVMPAPAPGLAPGRLHAVALGRLSAVKNLDVAITALSMLPADLEWHLDLVGEGGQREPLATLAANLGVTGRMTFHGFRRDAEALLAAADALVMPSRHEGLPYTLLEAMSLGLPVVASRVGGLAEVLRDGETGLLVPVGDIPAFADALRRLAVEPELRARLGQAAAREQRERYTLEAMGELYLEAYRAAIGAQDLR